MGEGDLTAQIDASAKDETGQLLLALKDMNTSLLNIVGEVRSGTDSIATSSTPMPKPFGLTTAMVCSTVERCE